VPVIVEPVRLAEDDLRLEVVGTGRARRSVTLRSRASGEIVSMALAPGARVEAGEVLMRLDDADERLALSLAETRLADARRTLERQRQLRASGTAALARLDEAETAAEIARLEVERAREALAERSLLAPFDGVAGLPEVETGAWVEEGEAIASLDDRSALLVEIDLPEAALGRLGAVSGGGDGLAAAGADVRSDAAGGAARIGAVTPTVPGRVFGAALEAVDSRVDPGSRTVRVRVAVPNENDALRPGASFTVRLDLPGGRYPVVPELALQFSRGSLHVWRLAGEAAERVEVVMIRRRDRTVLVDGPLAEGDRVVVEGTQRLRPGRAVRVLRDGAGGET
jgi:RND family efflux transporter MFP subunit